jgi:UrcA family protein
MTKISFGSVAVLGLCATAAVAQPPSARPAKQVVVIGEEQPTRHVSLADLNLRAEDDRKVLVHRVRAAVRSVCDEALGPSPIYYAEQSCRKLTWTDTQPQLSRAFQRAQEVAASGSGMSAVASITVQAPR